MRASKQLILSQDVENALDTGRPIVALESTVITHGLPYPQNLKLAQDMEDIIVKENVTPATTCVINGKIHVGIDQDQKNYLAKTSDLLKVSLRDFSTAIVKSKSGGTTVAGTMTIASRVGIRVFATGGIGGVHRRINLPTSRLDISPDLYALASTPMIVVCAGAKAILDLPATLEWLETFGVPVVGYQTNEFPAFYSRESGLSTSVRADSPYDVVKIAQAHWNLGLNSAILVTVPLPEEVALAPESVNEAIENAIMEAEARQIHGQAVTPFLLEKVSQNTGGASLKANLGLLHNNARVAAWISQAAIEVLDSK